ncbi:MAG TPA: AMP-binding protein [Pseudonocardiaceae bacterium]
MATHVRSEITSIPAERARLNPSGACVADDTRRLDNAGFAMAVDQTASLLADLGVSAGDTVAVMLPNCVELVTSMFAAWRLGAALTPVNPVLTDDEVLYQLRDSAAVVLVGEDRGRPLAAAADAGFLPATALSARTLARETTTGGRTPAAHSQAEDFALIIYTSGTTGRPKGVLLDHANLSAMTASLIEALTLGPADTSLVVLPLFHANGLVVSVLSALRAGGDIDITGRFDASTFWDIVAARRPTYLSAVPTIYARLEAQAPRAVDTSSLRFVICGAAPMPADLIGRFEARFGVPIIEGYGLSEGTVASTLNPISGPRKPGTVGVALPGQHVAIMAADGTRLPRGGRGEVIIRGANVMRGYLGKPDATEAVLRDGWLHTGDVGYLDDDGYLVLVDRIKDMIIRGGENIYPKEIEDVLYQHPAVLEAAVIGRADAVLGEVPVGYVALRPGAAVDVVELAEHCRARLARYKVPQEIRVLPQLPKNSVGKLVKGFLRRD